jgi:hypothetical protein
MQGNTVYTRKAMVQQFTYVHVVEFIATGCTMKTTRAETVHCWDYYYVQTVGKIVPIFSRLYSVHTIYPAFFELCFSMLYRVRTIN